MLNSVTYACTALAGMNKVGLLKPEEDGYYSVVLGGLNVYNSAGEFYTLDQARRLFEESGQLQRRIRKGALRAENGHPKMLPGMSQEQFAHRVMSIYEERVCAHIKEVTLDFDNVRDKNGQKVVAIMGKIAPAGELGHVLDRALKNPNENIAFSIRAFTDNEFSRMRVNRHLKSIVTWDYVGEQGIELADKYSNPALESFGGEVAMESHTFSRGVMERALVEAPGLIATESKRMTATELFQSCGWDLPSGAKPTYMGW